MTSLSPNKQRFNDTTAYTHLNESPSKYKNDNQSPNKGDSNNNADLKEEIQRIKQVKSDIMRHLKKLDFKQKETQHTIKKRLDAMIKPYSDQIIYFQRKPELTQSRNQCHTLREKYSISTMFSCQESLNKMLAQLVKIGFASVATKIQRNIREKQATIQ